MDEKLVVPACRIEPCCVASLSLDWSEIFQVDIDVREIFTLGLGPLIHLNDNRESLLSQDFN